MQATMARTAHAVGRGLVAGLAGTVAMTVSSTLEARRRGRADSDVPAQAVGTILGVEAFEDERARARTSQLAHWGYGIGLGAVRGLLDVAGLGRNVADIAFHGIVWAAEQTMLSTLGLAPPPTRWNAEAVATDLAHHAAYSLTTNGVYRWLSR